MKIKKENIMSIVLPFSVVFAYYPLSGVGSIGPLLVYLAVIPFLIETLFQKKYINCYKWLVILCLYIFITQPFLFAINGGFNRSRLINIITIFILLIVISISTINKDLFYKVYFYVALLASFLIIIQFVQINVLGQSVRQVMLLPMEIPQTWYAGGVRPTGIFPEPSAYAMFMLPLISYYIKENTFSKAIFFTMAIFASTSSNGIICVLVLWCVFFLSSKVKDKYKLLGIVIMIVAGFIIIKSGVFFYAIDKILNTDFTNNVRLTRGWDIYMMLDIPQKIFGIGVNNLEFFISEGKLMLTDSLSMGMTNKAYISGIYQVFIYYGGIGIIFYVKYLWQMFKNSNNKGLIIVFVLLTMSSSFLFNSMWLFYLFNIKLYEVENSGYIKMKL